MFLNAMPNIQKMTIRSVESCSCDSMFDAANKDAIFHLLAFIATHATPYSNIKQENLLMTQAIADSVPE